jgi:glutamine amidotransferase
MIAVIDYGMGNLRSVEKALQFVGATSAVTSVPDEVRNADKVVLPGVGSFGDAVEELRRRELIEPITEHIKRGKVFLGLCLGMQLLFPASEESPHAQGFSLFGGTVKKFVVADNSLKIPHMGWNQIAVGQCPLFRDIPDDSYMYFVHSYYAEPDDSTIVTATTDYGITFAAALWKDNVYAMQFHPEKSQRQGLQILKSFVDL